MQLTIDSFVLNSKKYDPVERVSYADSYTVYYLLKQGRDSPAKCRQISDTLQAYLIPVHT